ncbi:MAG TPA: hypothetical protein PK263_05090, partial [bacterium]|nr:hypothetical protein [bacterium]
VTSIEKGGKKYFAVEQPHKLLDLLETEEEIVKRNLNQLIDRKKRIRQIMPELVSMASTGSRPKVRFFEGKEGVVSAFEDTLKQPAGSEILMYSTTRGFYSEVPSYLDSYLKKRVAKKISVRLILPDDPLSVEYAKKDKEQLRQTRLVPAAKFPFTNEIDIYGNKLAIVSLEQEWLAVIIESESIAKTQRMIFELAWDGAKVNASGLRQ